MKFTPPMITASALLLSGLAALPARADDPTMQPLALVKECSHMTLRSGDYCSITKSSLAAIPVGSKVIYFGPIMEVAMFSSVMVIDAGDGDTTIGNCAVDIKTNAGTCSFWAGSGTLQGFQALLTLTADPDGKQYHWDGSYGMVGK